VAQLNATVPRLSADLKSLSLPLNATVEIVSEMMDPVNGLTPVVNNVSMLTNVTSLPTPTLLNDTTGISPPNPSNSTLVALLSGRLDNTEVRAETVDLLGAVVHVGAVCLGESGSRGFDRQVVVNR
jgi:hypothetical protein